MDVGHPAVEDPLPGVVVDAIQRLSAPERRPVQLLDGPLGRCPVLDGLARPGAAISHRHILTPATTSSAGGPPVQPLTGAYAGTQRRSSAHVYVVGHCAILIRKTCHIDPWAESRLRHLPQGLSHKPVQQVSRAPQTRFMLRGMPWRGR